MTESRPRPVLVYMAVVAALQAALGTAGIVELLPAKALAVAQLVLIALVAAGAFIVQGQVTPVSSPRDAAGNKLVPVGTAQAPEGAKPPRRMYDGGPPPPRTS